MKPIFVTGNTNKVKALNQWLGYELPHQPLELEEIQELDPLVVVEHKARQAYAILQKPVIIEDTSLDFLALGRLPGTYIKWFLQEVGAEGCCRLLDGFDSRAATARVVYCLYDGKELHCFSCEVPGEITNAPRGNGGFGWDPIFIPKDSQHTYAEMSEAKLAKTSVRNGAVKKLARFLDKQ